jgi:hypothetical protein
MAYKTQSPGVINIKKENIYIGSITMYKKIIILYLIAAIGILFVCPVSYSADNKTDKSIEIITLSLPPASEPVPALSYRLLPRYIDQKTGNAALLYYSAAGLYPDGNTEELNEKINKWRDLPVEQLNRKEVEEALSSFSSCFHQIKLASQRNSCEWELPIEDGFAMLLPNLGTYRKITYAMELQMRIDIADGHLDKAMEMIQQGMYMGVNIAKGPTIIHNLVGIAIDTLFLKNIESLIQKPNSPNLYWALTSLPKPLIDMHKAIQYEHEMVFVEFPELRNIETEILTPQQVLEITSNLTNKIQSLTGEGKNSSLMKLLPAGLVMIHYSDAKQYLAKKGFSQEQIDSMPAAQAVLIYQKQQYQEIADNMFKWLEIPYNQSQPYMSISEKQLSILEDQGVKTNLFSMLLPALSRVSFMQARLERNIAMLRTIEAIRMYAAANSGQIPEKLTDITSVPVPSDPVTGKDFIYQRTDLHNAQLEAPKAPDESQKRPVYKLSIKQ